MSRWAKMLWLVVGLSLVILLGVRFILGGWTNYLFIPLGLAGVGFVVAMIVDFKFYLEFFTMKTTKHGMNMGVMILLAIVMIVAVNFLGVRNNKTFDMTANKLFSLSEQTSDILKGLSDDLTIKVFYRAEKDNQQKQEVKHLLGLYQEVSSKVKVRYVNSYVEADQAEEYLSRGDQLTVFVEQGSRRVKVEAPNNEEKLTSAMIKTTRKDVKKIYFLTGHGERDLSGTDEEGISQLNAALGGASYEVGQLSLVQGESIPTDATIIAIVGPTKPMLEGEVKVIKDFAAKGGSLFIAIDPGQNHNVTAMLKDFGVDFTGQYVVNNAINRLIGRGQLTALGTFYDASHDITKKFRSTLTLFDVASEVKKADNAPAALKYTNLVKAHESSFSASKLGQGATMGNKREHTLALAVEGKLGATGEPKEGGKPEGGFTLVVVGDSDFLTNKNLAQGLNIDLALNSVAYMAKETDLISIRPKQPKGTKLQLTAMVQNSVVAAGVAVPLVFFILSGVFWYRRRNA